MRGRRAILWCVLAGVVVSIALVWPKPTEAERIEGETLEAAHKIQLFNGPSLTRAPILALELHLRGAFGKQDARNHYYEQVDTGLHRLQQLGVLEKRIFVVANTNALTRLVNYVSSSGSDVLWRVHNPANSRWFGGFRAV